MTCPFIPMLNLMNQLFGVNFCSSSPITHCINLNGFNSLNSSQSSHLNPLISNPSSLIPHQEWILRNFNNFPWFSLIFPDFSWFLVNYQKPPASLRWQLSETGKNPGIQRSATNFRIPEIVLSPKREKKKKKSFQPIPDFLLDLGDKAITWNLDLVSCAQFIDWRLRNP